MEIKLNKNEKIEDLQYKNLKIIQNKTGFCFGIDSVLLSDFAKNIAKGSKVLDLGTGTGIIATLLCGKTELKEIIGIEIQKEVFEMAQRSIALNRLKKRFKIINEDVVNLQKILHSASFDVIVTNPPYKKKGTGIQNEEPKKIISRHETTANLEDFIRISRDLLKDKGEFYMVHRPDRMVDIFSLMRRYQIEPKIIRFVYSNHDSEPKLVLIKGVKNARPFLKVQHNLYIYTENGEYTEEINRIYNR